MTEHAHTESVAHDDATLIARSLTAPKCFASLFDRHAPAIHGYIARRLGRDTADDLMAETFLLAFRGRDRYDQDYPDARPWLYGIATNLIGRRQRDEVRFFRAMARTGVDPAAEPVADEAARHVTAPSNCQTTGNTTVCGSSVSSGSSSGSGSPPPGSSSSSGSSAASPGP